MQHQKSACFIELLADPDDRIISSWEDTVATDNLRLTVLSAVDVTLYCQELTAGGYAHLCWNVEDTPQVFQRRSTRDEVIGRDARTQVRVISTSASRRHGLAITSHAQHHG